jgi:hypothetical protein
VLVLLLPLHVLGLAASASLAAAIFAVVGLAFALGTLRVLLREFDEVPLWMGLLAAAALVLSTTIPFLLRRPAVYEEAIASGFCFTMAGLCIAVRAIAQRRASLVRLALMSLCFGLAAGSRAPLIATALLIVPVFLAVRGTAPRRPLFAALAGPCGACAVLLLAYNVARFGNPLEAGQTYQLAGYNPQLIHFGKLGYLPPNLWLYSLSPPRPTVLFPFLALTPPPLTYPLSVPLGYLTPEITGGLLPMTPLLVLAPVLLWLRRRRPELAGPLATPLLVAAGAGLLSLLFLSFEFPAATERYETDFAGVFLFAALACWFALSAGPAGRRRRAVRVGGAMLALWGCFTGLAISFTGYYDLLHTKHPGTWSTLEDATSPISTAIATLAGRPILGEVQAPNLTRVSPVKVSTLGPGTVSFWLPAGGTAQLSVVSPDRREAAIVADLAVGAALRSRGRLTLRVKDASAVSHDYQVLGTERARLPILLKRGLNRVRLTPIATATNPPNPAVPATQQLLIVPLLAIGGT